MKHIIASVRDAKSEVFGRPFFAQTIGVAVRSFQDEVNRQHEDNMLYNHPSDFSLWALGTYEDTDGTIEVATPRILIQASEVKNAQK